MEGTERAEIKEDSVPHFRGLARLERTISKSDDRAIFVFLVLPGKSGRGYFDESNRCATSVVL